MRYAVIDRLETMVYSVVSFSGDFAQRKAEFEAVHPTQTIVDLGNSKFPFYLPGWYKSANDWFSYDDAGSDYNAVRLSVIAMIKAKSEELEYSGNYEYNGYMFPRSHESRDDIAILAALTSSSAELATQVLPYKAVSVSGDVVPISTAAEARAFVAPVLAHTKAVADAQAVQIDAVNGMGSIVQLIQYTDPR